MSEKFDKKEDQNIKSKEQGKDKISAQFGFDLRTAQAKEAKNEGPIYDYKIKSSLQSRSKIDAQFGQNFEHVVKSERPKVVEKPKQTVPIETPKKGVAETEFGLNFVVKRSEKTEKNNLVEKKQTVESDLKNIKFKNVDEKQPEKVVQATKSKSDIKEIENVALKQDLQEVDLKKIDKKIKKSKKEVPSYDPESIKKKMRIWTILFGGFTFLFAVACIIIFFALKKFY